ncbi:MAG: ABC transporter permease [Planctomycetota bacterium]
MIPAFSPFLALRYLVTRRINLLGMLGVAFAVWAMLIVDGVFTGFVQDIRRNVRQSAPDLLLTELPNDTAYEPLREALEADADVVITAPRLRHQGILQPLARTLRSRGAKRSSQLEFDHTANGFALLLGIDPLREAQVVDLAGWLERGPAELGERIDADLPRSPVLDDPDPSRREKLLLPDEMEWRARGMARLPREPNKADHRSIWPGVLLGWRRASHSGLQRFAMPFDLLVASFPPPATEDAAPRIYPFSMKVGFAGFYDSGHRMFDEATALLPIESLRTALGQDLSDPYSIDLVTDVAIRPKDNLTAAQLRSLQQRLQEAAQAVLPAGSPPCAVYDWREQNSVFLSAVAQEQAMMQIVLFVVMLVSAFVIYATLHMMVVQKIKDIGIVAAIGGSPRGIGQIFLVTGLVIGTVGTALGVGAGLLSSVLLNPANDWLFDNFGLELFPRRLFDLDRVPCELQTPWVVTIAIGAILLSLLVAYVPARKASRMNPVLALGHE